MSYFNVDIYRLMNILLGWDVKSEVINNVKMRLMYSEADGIIVMILIMYC